MLFLSVMLKRQLKQLILIIVLTLLSSMLGVAVMNFINQYLLVSSPNLTYTLLLFIVLAIGYLVAATLNQIAISAFGHRIVRELQNELFNRLLNSHYADIVQRPKSQILASLANDIQHISFAFVRLPELFQGGLFVLLVCFYMAYLSMPLFLVTAIWLCLTLVAGHSAVKRVYQHLAQARRGKDALYANYETSLDGVKELLLNQPRRQQLALQFKLTNATYYRNMVRADSYHALAGNVTNVMMLLAVGFIFYLSLFFQWASFNDAVTMAIALLFVRSPLISAVGALPTVMQAHVSFKAIEQLNLKANRWSHQVPMPFSHWQAITLKHVTYQYPAGGFSLRPTDFTLQRGETVFVIGQNGSGKSTLSLLLTGLLSPSSGTISVDNCVIDQGNIDDYRQLFAAVFTDFHLFSDLWQANGEKASPQLVKQWLATLQLQHKIQLEDNRLSTTQLSQGQRKRLGLLQSVVEEKSILILDEWAADQDPAYRQNFYQTLLPLLKQQGYTIFAISHDDKYFHHADRIIEVVDGNLHEITVPQGE